MKMLIAFDIGNTNIAIGCFQDDQFLFEMRLTTDRRRTVDEYGGLFRTLLREKLDREIDFDAAVICSVVPPLTPCFEKLVQDYCHVDPLLVGLPGVKTGLSIKTSNPAAVGADRVVNAVAVKQFYGVPALAIDFGTATSFDYVDSQNSYLGGIIVPGLEIALDALVSNTAKLPRIQLAWPEHVLGRDTESAMQSGAVIGYHCLIDGLIELLIKELGPIPHVVATGGSGGIIAEHSKQIVAYDPHLILKGMHFLAKLNL